MERYRTTIIMAVALIVLVALAFFLTSKNASAPTGSPTPTTAKYIWQDTNAVKAIDVVSGTQKVGIAKDSHVGQLEHHCAGQSTGRPIPGGQRSGRSAELAGAVRADRND